MVDPIELMCWAFALGIVGFVFGLLAVGAVALYKHVRKELF